MPDITGRTKGGIPHSRTPSNTAIDKFAAAQARAWEIAAVSRLKLNENLKVWKLDSDSRTAIRDTDNPVSVVKDAIPPLPGVTVTERDSGARISVEFPDPHANIMLVSRIEAQLLALDDPHSPTVIPSPTTSIPSALNLRSRLRRAFRRTAA